MILLLIGAYLFLGSKLQVMTASPIIILMIIKILWDNRKIVGKEKFGVLAIGLVLLISHTATFKITSEDLSKDTQYNSVFYGILKDSENPKQDLIDMGLNPDMSVEAGKHAYLDISEYVKYIPLTEITEQEFYNKMSNGKLVEFYIKHPIRLIKGMETTASEAFLTSTSLGKYKESYSEVPIRNFNRFTVWSKIKEYLPKHFAFIVLVYMIVFIASLFEFKKNKRNKEFRAKVLLLWALMIISILQYPMPFVGNGYADIKKQVYLFDFIFDIILITSICWCLNSTVKLFKIKKL
jgi:hypothetical protein